MQHRQSDQGLNWNNMDNIILIQWFVLILTPIALIVLIFRRSRPVSGRDVAQNAVLKERIAAHEAEESRLMEELQSLKEEARARNRDIELRDKGIANLEMQIAVIMKELEGERELNKEKIRLLKESREELSNHFKVLANDILDEKTRTFKEMNKTGIDEILNPLKDRLLEFQNKIQENYETEGKERHYLKNEIRKLIEMNDRLSQEASNLTNALKGDNKSQGHWGEMILERVLEMSGLRRGVEYKIQESHTRDDRSRVQPDVVIHLPEDRYLIIDSKVSLNAYSDYVNLKGAKERDGSLKNHIRSVRTHINGLAEKEYHKLYEEKSPDFVIMFIPIEPAFTLALTENSKLWEDAWKNNILLVSPSTLLFVMRIVMQLWRQEQRSRNALDIARRGSSLYEKFVGFVEDFELIGNRIGQAGKSFESAKGKLSTGRGNLIRQALMLKDLGITPGKHLPADYEESSKGPL